MTVVATYDVQGDTEVLKLIHPGWTVVLTVFAAMAVIGFGCVGFPSGDRSWSEIQSGLNGAHALVEESGFVLIGIAISLVAIAITAIAIMGISEPDHRSERRRFSIMRIAELLLFSSLLFLMGCAVASALGFAGLIWEAHGETVYSAGNSMTFTGGVALVLWVGVDLIRKRIVEIYISDALAMRMKKEGIQDRIDNYKEVLKKVNSPLWEGQKDLRFGISWTIKRALGITAICLTVAILVAIAIYLIQNSSVPLGEMTSGAMSIFVMVLLFQLMCVAFTLFPFLWAASYWNLDTSPASKWLKVCIFIFYLFAFLWIYCWGLFSALTDGTNISPLTALALVAAIVIPVLASFICGGAKSWRSVSKHYASIRLNSMIDQLVEKLDLLESR